MAKNLQHLLSRYNLKDRRIKKVCLITPGHIATNPRLVKEASVLLEAGYQVHVVFTQYVDLLLNDDQLILTKYRALTFDKLKWTKNLRLRRIISGLTQIISRFSCRIFKDDPNFHQIVLNRNYNWQLKNAIRAKADLYIAHNAGALAIARNAAKHNATSFGFDAEDYHRNETSNNPNDFQVKLKAFLEDKYLKDVDYITAASPLIGKAYQNLYPNLKPIVINNVFEVKQQPPINLNKNEGLKLFWFSQTIGKNRGLEDIIEALNIIDNTTIQLHLLGSLSKDDEAYFNGLAKFDIYYYQPISGDEIFSLAAKFDIGLALEQDRPLNRDICLTNKIFTYLISGLAIIASATQAQKQLLEENRAIGGLYPIGNVAELKKIIIQFLNDKDLLNEYKNNAYQLAQSKYNWEIESKKFINIVEQTLAD